MTSAPGRPPSSGPDSPPILDANLYRQAVEVAPVPMIVVGGDGTVLLANSAALELFGYPASDLIGKPVEELVPEGLRPVHREYRDKFVQRPDPRPMGEGRDLVAVTRDGAAVPVEIGLSPVETSEGLMVICAVVDLTVRKKNERDLAELAELLGDKNQRLLELVATDSLTSLMSRRVFLDSLNRQLENSARHARPLSVLILDIDDFKAYNDEFGHLAGDEALRRFGRILLDTARRSDLVARLGGEEFGIALPEADAGGSKTLAERFRKAVEEAEWPERPITTSVGAMTVTFEQSVPRPSVPDVSQLLSEADRALYRSKETGKNRITHSSDLPPRP